MCRLQVALLSKHAIIIADKKLANACTVHETIRVKVQFYIWPALHTQRLGSTARLC